MFHTHDMDANPHHDVRRKNLRKKNITKLVMKVSHFVSCSVSFSLDSELRLDQNADERRAHTHSAQQIRGQRERKS